MKYNAGELEEFLIPVADWGLCPYPEAVEMARKESDAGYPTGIAKDPDGGWWVLGCGQGPFIMWPSESSRQEENDEY